MKPETQIVLLLSISLWISFTFNIYLSTRPTMIQTTKVLPLTVYLREYTIDNKTWYAIIHNDEILYGSRNASQAFQWLLNWAGSRTVYVFGTWHITQNYTVPHRLLGGIEK